MAIPHDTAPGTKVRFGTPGKPVGPNSPTGTIEKIETSGEGRGRATFAHIKTSDGIKKARPGACELA